MATEFIDKYAEDEYVLTSRLDTIRARTDKQKVTVRVVRNPDVDIDEFFSTTLYAFGGVVELSAVGKLIEERFRAEGRTRDMMEISIDDATLAFIAVYCTHTLNTDFDLHDCFWSTAATAVVHRQSMVYLSHHDTGSINYHVKVVGINSDGTIGMVEKDFTRNPLFQYLSFPVNDIIRFALNQTNDETGGDLVKVSYFAVSYGDIQKIFYLTDDPEYLSFQFQNLFNCPEVVDVVGKVKKKSAVDRDTAVCGGMLRHYNQVVNQTYEVETGPLTADQALTLEDMMASHDVKLLTTPDELDVIITDHTCETDNDDDTLLTMKFTFRLTGDRPTLLGSAMDALVPNRTNIFSKEFTAEFA